MRFTRHILAATFVASTACALLGAAAPTPQGGGAAPHGQPASPQTQGSPTEAVKASAQTLGADAVTGAHAPEGLASCEVYKARDMCCPIWCAGRKSRPFEAAKALSQCAQGYGCEWHDNPTTAGFHCDRKCD